MIQTIFIDCFRGFESLEVNGLQRVNLVTGRNNVGKTSFLESLYFLFSPKENLRLDSNIFRYEMASEDAFENNWKWLFFNKKTQKNGNLIAKMDGGLGKEMIFTVVPSQNNLNMIANAYSKSNDRAMVISSFQGTPSFWVFGTEEKTQPWCDVATLDQKGFQNIIEFFSLAIAKKNGETKLTNIMKFIEPRLTSLRYLKISKNPLVYADIDLDFLVPIAQFGQGFNRVLQIVCKLIISEAKILLIDEIESGIHTSALKTVWRGLIELARAEDVQIFATTHSYECIQAALDAYGEDEEFDFALHRLQRNREDKIEAVTFDRETIETAIKQEWELR